MNMIENHMEQIALSAAAIAELPFPPPKIFTNALLHPHDITALIRDTEAHERALFKVVVPEPGSFEPVRRKSVFFGHGNEDALPGGAGGAAARYAGLKPKSAVGRILGGDLLERIKASERRAEKGKGDVDVEVLLKGAEKLCGIYPIPGVQDKISAMRARHERLTASISKWEAKVAKQATQLDRINHPSSDLDAVEDEDEDEDGEDEDAETETESEAYENDNHAQQRDHDGRGEEAPIPAVPARQQHRQRYSAEDLEREEAEMRDLEAKKRSLEERVSGMEKDLGGLMR